MEACRRQNLSRLAYVLRRLFPSDEMAPPSPNDTRPSLTSTRRARQIGSQCLEHTRLWSLFFSRAAWRDSRANNAAIARAQVFGSATGAALTGGSDHAKHVGWCEFPIAGGLGGYDEKRIAGAWIVPDT